MPCFAKFLLENQKEYGIVDEEIAYIAGSMFGAGSDTVSIETIDLTVFNLLIWRTINFSLPDGFRDHHNDDGGCSA